MSEIFDEVRPLFIVDERGAKSAVVMSLDEFNRVRESVEDLEDAMDLLKAELEAVGFTPYEEFRKQWLTP